MTSIETLPLEVSALNMACASSKKGWQLPTPVDASRFQ
jgi:hypothetical protein